ncbi:MAG: HAMP domain-containing histidine kinase [Clostridia bacterium]|nr:HAMP domain-containing histidine kinase [Clostridia bacterium]
MKKTSIKKKIAIFSLIAALISIVFCLVLAYAIGTAHTSNVIRNELKAEVKKAEKRIESGKSLEGIDYNGAHDGRIVVYNSTGEEVYNSGETFPHTLPPFDSKDWTQFEAEKEKYYVYDKKAVVNDDEYQVRGIISATDNAMAYEHMFKSMCFLAPLDALLVAFFVWLISKLCLNRLDKLNTSASSIINEKDLERRISTNGYSDEISEMTDTINNLLSRLESSFNNEKRFISDASHELRTPTSVILAQSELLKTGSPTTEEYSQANEVVYIQAVRMKRLISELLEISRTEQGQVKKEFETLDVSEIIENVAAEQREVHKTNVNLTTTVEPKLVADVNRLLFIRMIDNLVDNAYKYCKDGGKINISASLGQALDLSKTLQIIISDDGIGISEEDLPKIWDRFFRADQSRTGDNGTGLGLSMVKWIVSYHGGTISVESKLNVGTTFTIELPCKH